MTNHSYLGNVVQCDGSNGMNILSRVSKGQAVIRDILQILEGTYFGSFYFDVVKLHRESMLLSVITHNLEVSFNLSEKDIKLLHNLDIQLLRRSFLLGAKSSHCLILLELGLSPVSFILKKKRVIYLHHLLTTDPSSLVSLVFWEQVRTNRRGDWITTVIQDLDDFGLNRSFSQIASMSKNAFKMLVKSHCDNACFQYLISEKLKLSKGSEICYDKLETHSYLSPESGLSLETMRRIFHIRSRELPLKTNFRYNFKDLSCLHPSCSDTDSQIHIFSSNCFSDQNEIVTNEIKYSDIFGHNVQLQVNVTNIMYSKLEQRKKFMTLSGEGFPLDPRSTKLPKLGIQKAKQKHKSKTRK